MVKMQGCHRQLTIKAGNGLEEMTVKVVLTVLSNSLGAKILKRSENKSIVVKNRPL